MRIGGNAEEGKTSCLHLHTLLQRVGMVTAQAEESNWSTQQLPPRTGTQRLTHVFCHIPFIKPPRQTDTNPTSNVFGLLAYSPRPKRSFSHIPDVTCTRGIAFFEFIAVDPSTIEQTWRAIDYNIFTKVSRAQNYWHQGVKINRQSFCRQWLVPPLTNNRTFTFVSIETSGIFRFNCKLKNYTLIAQLGHAEIGAGYWRFQLFPTIS